MFWSNSLLVTNATCTSPCHVWQSLYAHWIRVFLCWYFALRWVKNNCFLSRSISSVNVRLFRILFLMILNCFIALNCTFYCVGKKFTFRLLRSMARRKLNFKLIWATFILTVYYGLINYIDTEAKCRHLKKWPVKGLLRRFLFRVV